MKNNFIDLKRMDILSKLDQLVCGRLCFLDEVKKYRMLMRLHELHVIQMMAGLEEFSWQWLHENNSCLVFDDYELFEPLAEIKKREDSKYEEKMERLTNLFIDLLDTE